MCVKRSEHEDEVLDDSAMRHPSLNAPPFDVAPALFAYNVPRYYIVLLRARQFARTHRRMLSLCFAQDGPLHREDRDLPEKQLHAKRLQWLRLHDQQTSHIASQVPLVVGLPVRLTDTIDRQRSLFRGRRGFIVGWAPRPGTVTEGFEGECFLSRMPLAIYVRLPDAEWRVHVDLDPGV